MLILHICAGRQVLFDYFDVSSFAGMFIEQNGGFLLYYFSFG